MDIDDPEAQSCIAGSIIVDGVEVPVSEETTGVTHLLEDIADERVRLIIFEAAVRAGSVAGSERLPTSIRQCLACTTVFIDRVNDRGLRFLHVYRPGKLFGAAPAHPDDRAEPST